MLRSYQYTPKSYMGYSMQDDSFREKELGLVRVFVDSHPIRHDMDNMCPICRKRTGHFYFNKWNIDYLRCDECGSLFAVCDEETIREYLTYDRLNEFRLSDAYQRQITGNRKDSWQEYLEWVEVRTYRFLGRNKELNILDLGNRLTGFIDMIKGSDICGEYRLTESVGFSDTEFQDSESADIIFCNDVLKTDTNPHERIEDVKHYLKKNGLLFIGARAGSGFDVITLKENNTRICPYEHILLPSVRGMIKLLTDNGFEVLEITTPGVMDVKYVMDDIGKLDAREEFVRHLLREADDGTLQEFQRFLQKSCMSSYIRVIARKAGNNETI